MGIGTNLKNILADKEMKVSELAEKSGVTPQTIYAIIKRDNKTVKPDILNKLASALNVSIQELTLEEWNLSNLINDIISRPLNDTEYKEKIWNTYFLEQDILNSDNKEMHHLILNYYDTLNQIGRDSLLEILGDLNVLNDMGAKEAAKRIEELTYIEKYKK